MIKNKDSTKSSDRRKSANWRIVIPNLQQYKNSTPEQLLQLKYLILERLKHRPQDKRSNIKSQFQRGLRYYRIAVQHHANGVPHLDILLIYQKSIQRQLVDWDYLYKHGNVTKYGKLNAAILDYGKKQDAQSLHNFPTVMDPETKIAKEQYSQLIQLQDVKKDPYLYLYNKMCKDPLHFNVQQYVKTHQLSQHITGWSSLKTKLKDMQIAAANLSLKQKPGFQYISRALIQSRLSPQQLLTYDSWPGYQKIVDYLNQIVIYGSKRPFKSKNLLIVGSAGIGKTSLVSEPNNIAGRVPIQQMVSTYHMGMRHWFPKYRDGVYKLLLWNQMKLTAYSYDFLLKFLEGSPVDLAYHGGATKKADNQLVYMTSNLPLERHIKIKFTNFQDRQSATQNLSKRIQQIIVPPGYKLFLLQKLLIDVDKKPGTN